ncbi:MAG TPA: thioredoxin [Candidatus Baltobacteraceae bacterium]|nr:thioredoxin [Candidatus Baltobacteraceae bacterium]
MEIILNEQSFETEVLKSDVPVLVDFWAPWCGPCKIMGPIIEEVAKELEGKPVKVGKMNVDENPETPAKYGIMSIPTIIIFKNGEPAEQLVGVQAKEKLLEKLNALM